MCRHERVLLAPQATHDCGLGWFNRNTPDPDQGTRVTRECERKRRQIKRSSLARNRAGDAPAMRCGVNNHGATKHRWGAPHDYGDIQQVIFPPY
jgi:hypothetical protein